jgi:pyridoxal phosphate enzyme (YggS family)
LARQVERLDPERVRANLAEARERVRDACVRAGRDPDSVEILAATKYVPAELMGALVEGGLTLAGENTAQALEAKHRQWGDAITFDFIGHLQSRKTKTVLPLARLVHSVQSESVLDRVEREEGRGAGLLLQVNLAGEESKDGVALEDVDAFLEAASARPHVRFSGLMAMPPLASDPDATRPCFAALRELAERLERDWASRHDFSILSMGTSQDFEAAVEEGATICRLGGVLYR